MTESILEGQALTAHINDLNARVIRGEPVSDDEIRQAVLALRSKRRVASTTSKAGKRASAPQPMQTLDLEALFAPKGPSVASLDLDDLLNPLKPKES